MSFLFLFSFPILPPTHSLLFPFFFSFLFLSFFTFSFLSLPIFIPTMLPFSLSATPMPMVPLPTASLLAVPLLATPLQAGSLFQPHVFLSLSLSLSLSIFPTSFPFHSRKFSYMKSYIPGCHKEHSSLFASNRATHGRHALKLYRHPFNHRCFLSMGFKVGING